VKVKVEMVSKLKLKNNILPDLNEKLATGYLLFYGYSYKVIPDQVKKNYISRMNFYFKAIGQKNQLTDDVQIHNYNGYQDTGWETCDVVFFDQNSVKSLLIGFPSNAKYILINCANFRYYHWVILGLMRRLFIRQVKFMGIKKLTHGQKKSFWIILKRDQLIDNNNFYLSREIGVEGFLNHLRKEKINYVVPRFFESLPNLHRDGGDLDLIVSDHDENYAKQFLLDNEGDIRIDIWTVGRPNYHGITYMPPHIAQKVIDDAINGKASAKIPNLKDAFLCMIYHVLYHKGFRGGVPSVYDQYKVSKAKNDYLGCIRKFAIQLDLEIKLTMEDLDDYMLKSGWRPERDTLAKIAQWNEWVNVHHFQFQPKIKTDLFAIIIKAEAVKRNLSKDVITECLHADYVLLENSLLNEKVQKLAIKNIRGGVWNDGLKDGENISKYYPAQILILLDKFKRGESGLKQLKSNLRNKFDDTQTSYFHSTDNNQETWDYIKICIPDKEIILLDAIKNSKNPPSKKYFLYNKRSFQLIYSNFKTNVKSILIRILSH
jgi:hypothetical protein